MAYWDKKKYIMVKPSDFERYGTIDSEGDVKRECVPDFNLFNVDLNFLLFVVKTNRDHTDYDIIATEIVSGREFDFKTTKQNGKTVFLLENSTCGLYLHKYLQLDKAIVEPSLAAGRMTNINNCEPIKMMYLSAVKEVFDTALNRKVDYETAKNEGPGIDVITSLRDSYRKLKQ